MDRTVNTLFMLMSVDGKIGTGAGDNCDFDHDLPDLPGVADGLAQYYDLEKRTDLWSFNSARVLAKIGYNHKKELPSARSDVSFLLVDNAGHLQQPAIRYLSAALRQVVIATTQPHYRTYDCENVAVIHYDGQIDFADLFRQMKAQFGAARITIQSGGTLNGVLLRANLIDYLDIVVAPLLVGGAAVPTLIDGPSISGPDQLSQLASLALIDAQVLANSYLRLTYQVLRKASRIVN